MPLPVKIVTDSTAYVEPEIVQQNDITIIPITIAFGTAVFAEGVNITNDEFYRRVSQGSVFPNTSQPPIGEFIRVYRGLADRGHPVLSIHVSSRMSGTVSTARRARDELAGAEIEVIDSPTLAMGIQVIEAARLAREGRTLKQIKAAIEELGGLIKNLGMLGTLKYAGRGGRIGAARALLGTLLQIKPVLTFKNDEVKILAKPRTVSRAIDFMANFVGQQAKGNAVLRGWLGHARAEPSARALEKELRSCYKWSDLRLFELGPVYGTHLGPGFIGVGFYDEKMWKGK